MGSGDLKGTFVTCERCGKKLIERKKNGLWHFIFGKPPKNGNGFIPVEMFIQGNVKIKCLRRSCGHWQILNFFPTAFQSDDEAQTVHGGKKEMINKETKEV